jgi:hypothetical protein
LVKAFPFKTEAGYGIPIHIRTHSKVQEIANWGMFELGSAQCSFASHA